MKPEKFLRLFLFYYFTTFVKTAILYEKTYNLISCTLFGLHLLSVCTKHEQESFYWVFGRDFYSVKEHKNIDQNKGFSINVIEFDYLLKKNSGITFSGFYAQNKIPDSNEKIFSAGMLFGAIGHYSIAKHLSIDVMPMGGVRMASAYAKKNRVLL